MLKNFQRYFRFYLASFLLGLLLVGIRWQAAPLGAPTPATSPAPGPEPAAAAGRVGAGTAAVRVLP